MGVDLTLMPVMFSHGWLCHEMIKASRNYDTHDAIRAADPDPVGVPVSSHLAQDDEGNSTYGDTTTNPYGGPLTWLSAGVLALIFAESEGWKDQAIGALLAKYPPDWPVVIYWH